MPPAKTVSGSTGEIFTSAKLSPIPWMSCQVMPPSSVRNRLPTVPAKAGCPVPGLMAMLCTITPDSPVLISTQPPPPLPERHMPLPQEAA